MPRATSKMRALAIRRYNSTMFSANVKRTTILRRASRKYNYECAKGAKEASKALAAGKSKAVASAIHEKYIAAADKVNMRLIHLQDKVFNRTSISATNKLNKVLGGDKKPVLIGRGEH